MRLKERPLMILKMLLKQDGAPLKISDISSALNVSDRTVRNDLDDIREELHQNSRIELLRKPGTGVWIKGDPADIQKCFKLVEEKTVVPFFTQEKRVTWIVFRLLSSDRPMLLKEIEATLKISLSSVQRDFEQVENLMNEHQFTIHRKSAHGYWVTGDEWVRRQWLFTILDSEIDTDQDITRFRLNQAFTSCISNVTHFQQRIPAILALIDKSPFNFTLQSKTNIVLHLFIIWMRSSDADSLNFDAACYGGAQEALHSLSEKLIRTILGTDAKINEHDVHYLTIHLVSSRYSTTLAPDQFSLKDDEVVSRMITIAGSFLGLDLHDDHLLRTGLFNHLDPMINRITHNIPVESSDAISIEELYPGISAAALAASQVVEAVYNVKVPKREMDYIALYFGAAIERQSPKLPLEKLHAVIICETGLGTSQFVKERLTRFLPNIHIEDVVSRYEAYRYQDDAIDLYMTTVPLNPDWTKKPVINVKPIPDYTDLLTIQSLITDIQSDQPHLYSNYSNDIIAIAKKYGLNDENFNDELIQYLQKTGIEAANTPEPQLETKKGLLTLLPENRITITDEELNCEESVFQSVELLEHKLCVLPDYKHAVINRLKSNGPYMLVTHHVALLHAKPEEGALEPSMSLLLCKKGVNFNKPGFDPVYLIFSFAATDDYSHLQALSELLLVVGEQRHVNALREMQDTREIRPYLQASLLDGKGDDEV
ncbi:putative licABCH operon regulator [Salisediminibacterium beveridgei]|uniref:Putative licABCH operon regulator n=2 Tax=Salisediminibacterium beveridgei TaxID=632773 RepID=A0A1D7QZQ5_9BACI|nr:putative licABCH operon regulator [Salisediminibacterium beveridgei]